MYHKSPVYENKNEMLYRIAVFDENYEKCSLELPHKSKVIIQKDGTLAECIEKVQKTWYL
ncbi:MAG: hypothetical protein FWH29_06930 [Methanobrevibacter sp.]|nr:hypothetical protein [Methanobrevibacter sp.]